MKAVKKFLCAILALMIISSSFCSFVYAQDDSTQLQFNSNGKFKIMAFADAHSRGNIKAATMQLMTESLDKYKPDLVVFLGDNTIAKGYNRQYNAIEELTEPVRSRNIPYAMVFGNHDQEHGVSKEDLLKIYREFGCLTYDAVPELYGCGNCNLPILSSDGSKIAFNLWFMDSGSKNPDQSTGEYDYVRKDQINWYKQTAAALAAQNGGEVVPAINFQHITVAEMNDVIFPSLPFPLGDATQMINGIAYSYVPYFTKFKGFVFETLGAPWISDGQYYEWLKTGDVMAAFYGHDHINTYRAVYKGIENISVPTVGYDGYGNDLARGVGLITLDENSPKDYKYELFHIYDMALDRDSLISEADGGKSKFEYFMIKMVSELLLTLQSIFTKFMAM